MTEDDFKAFYAARLRPELENIDARRRSARVRALRWFWAALALAVLGVFTELPGLVIVSVVAFAIVLIWHDQRWGKSFRVTITPKLLGMLGTNIHYDANSGVPRAEFLRCGLFHPEPDDYKVSDYLQARIGETPVRFSQVNASYEEEDTTTDSDGHSKTERRTVTIFSGVLFTATFNKVFHGTTQVLPRSALGRLGLGELKIVKLEDPTFHRIFDVSATDQIEARYILSTSLMQRLLSLAARLGEVPMISFIDGQIYIALSGVRLLKKYPSLFSSRAAFFDPRRYENALGGISGLIEIVDELNLNRRIWGGSSVSPIVTAKP